MFWNRTKVFLDAASLMFRSLHTAFRRLTYPKLVGQYSPGLGLSSECRIRCPNHR